MVGQDHVGHGAQGSQLRVRDHIAHAVVVVQAVLVFQHVQTGSTHLPAFQRSQQSVAVDQLAAGGVHDGHTGLHLGKGIGVEQMVVLLGSVSVQGDDIALRDQGLQRHILCDLLHLIVLVQVVGQQFTAKAGQVLQHGLPDAPRADNAHGAVGDVPADLALQGVVLQLTALEDMPRLAQAHQHEHNGKVRHTVGGIIHIGNLHAQLPRLFQIHMVVADGAAADGLHPKVMKALQHGCAHITGCQRYRIVACGQLGVLHGRIRLGIAVLDAPLLCQILQDALLIVGAQSIEKHFDCHKILLLVLLYRNACLCGATCIFVSMSLL